VLATARDGEHAWHGHLEARAALARQATSLHLLPLSEAHIRELIVHTTDMPRPDMLAERIHARTGGNPLLVSELIRPLREQPANDSSPFGATVPASVRAITAERLVGCSSLCQRLVSVAAVLGTRFGSIHFRTSLN
jgi:predicted ATPase